MNESVKDRLLQFLKASGIKKGTFEKQCGFSNGYMNQLRHEPSREKIEIIISKYPKLNFKWLMTGEGKMIVDVAPDLSKGTPRVIGVYERNEKQEKEQPRTNGSPYYDVDFLGGFDLMVNNQTNTPDGYINIPTYNTPGLLWCNITGHSMEPMINHGDIIALKELEDWHTYLPKGEVYGIVTTNGLRTVKIVRKGSDENHIRLVPVNTSDYDEEEIPITAIMRVFRIVGNLKRF